MKTPFHNPRILFLAIATFAVGTDAYVIAGILPEIAQDLRVPVDQAGLMVTLFALAYAVGSPLLAVLTARVARRWLLIAVLLGLCVANMLSALAPTFRWMLITRVLAAGCAALCSPTALAIAATPFGFRVRPREHPWNLRCKGSRLFIGIFFTIPPLMEPCLSLSDLLCIPIADS